MLDTDICIYIAKGRPAKVRERIDQLKPGSVVISVVTYGELHYGASNSDYPEKALRQLDIFLQNIPVEGLSRGAGQIYGQLRTTLESKGLPSGSNDLWIAAHAIDLGATLATNNEREFRRVPGLKFENWAA
jgi:tRNA(fMet)-specific endonuclease VapC